MKVVGLRVEKYVGKAVTQREYQFSYHDEIFERHVICGIDDKNRMVEVTLYQEEGSCGSGYCTADFGRKSVEIVERFYNISHFPIKDLYFKDEDAYSENYDGVYGENVINNDVFEVDETGGDDYYPNGHYNVYMDNFVVTKRVKNERPIWLFVGESNMGKSFIASHLNDVEVYETDISETLPNDITATVIVVGNKWKHNIEDIESRILGDHITHKVEFKF